MSKQNENERLIDTDDVIVSNNNDYNRENNQINDEKDKSIHDKSSNSNKNIMKNTEKVLGRTGSNMNYSYKQDEKGNNQDLYSTNNNIKIVDENDDFLKKSETRSNFNNTSHVSGYYDHRRSRFDELNPKVSSGYGGFSKDFSSSGLQQTQTFNKPSPQKTFSPKRYVSPIRYIDSNTNLYDYRTSYDYLYDKYLSPRRIVYSPRRIVYSPTRVVYSPSYYYPRKVYVSPYRIISPVRTIVRSPVRYVPTYSCSPIREEKSFLLKQKEKSTFLSNFLNDLVVCEGAIEKQKQEFAIKGDLGVNDLFGLFDIRGLGYISIFDFKNTLLDLGIFLSLDEIKLLFRRFDKDLDGKLSYNELSEIFLPQKDEYASLINQKYSIDPIVLTEISIYQLRSLLDVIVNNERQVEHSRKSLNSRPFFSSYDYYELIKGKYLSYISREDLSQFLLENSSFSYSNFEIDLIFRRIDKNNDYQISFNEFISEVIPQ